MLIISHQLCPDASSHIVISHQLCYITLSHCSTACHHLSLSHISSLMLIQIHTGRHVVVWCEIHHLSCRFSCCHHALSDIFIRHYHLSHHTRLFIRYNFRLSSGVIRRIALSYVIILCRMDRARTIKYPTGSGWLQTMIEVSTMKYPTGSGYTMVDSPPLSDYMICHIGLC